MESIATMLKKRTGRIIYKIDKLRQIMSGAAPGRRVVFMHIPKCAGSSVNAVFKHAIGPSRIGSTILIDDRFEGSEYDRKIEMARTTPFVGGHFGFETLQAIRGDALTFTVLRDPFARLRSTYGHFHTRADGNPLGHKVPHMTIEDYLLSDDPEILQWTDNVIARQLCARHDRASVAHIDTQTMISRAIANLDTLDKVVFLDDLDSAMKLIASAAKIRFYGGMPRENVTSQRAARHCQTAIAPLDERLKAIARPRVAADLIVYQHALERFARSALHNNAKHVYFSSPIAAA